MQKDMTLVATSDLEKVSDRRSGENSLVQECSVCKGKIMLDAGDVIFGGQWYHGDCWQVVEERILNSLDQ